MMNPVPILPPLDYTVERSWQEVFGPTLFSFPATIQARASNATLLDLAKSQSPVVDPTVFDEHPPFMAMAEVSNNKIDAYFTRMMPSSLRNYAEDYAMGVSVLSGHDTRAVFGRSLTGTYAGPQGNGVANARAEFYTIPGLQIGAANSDQLILAIRSGILQDVSNGFYGGDTLCSICGMDIWRWACPHMPGESYNAEGKPDSSGTMCIGNVEGARSAEFSIVYDGATPGAGLLKAQQLAATGRMVDGTRAVIERRYRTQLPAHIRSFTGVTIATHTTNVEEGTTMPPEATQTAAPAVDPALIQVRSVLATCTYPADIGTATESQVRWLVAEHARLAPLADDGRAYRADLVEQAIAEGVRANGPDFAVETYTAMLAGAPIEVIKRMRDDWQAIGNKHFPGGRATVEPETPAVESPATTHNFVPDAAFVA